MKTVVLIWVALITLPLAIYGGEIAMYLIAKYPQAGATVLLGIGACALMVFDDRRRSNRPPSP